MEEHVGEMAIQMCREVLLPSAKRRRLLVSLVCILFEGTIRGSCFYSNNANMGSCEQEAVGEIHMKGTSSKKKQRLVCRSCLEWLVDGGVASIVVPNMLGGHAPFSNESRFRCLRMYVL